VYTSSTAFDVSSVAVPVLVKGQYVYKTVLDISATKNKKQKTKTYYVYDYISLSRVLIFVTLSSNVICKYWYIGTFAHTPFYQFW